MPPVDGELPLLEEVESVDERLGQADALSVQLPVLGPTLDELRVIVLELRHLGRLACIALGGEDVRRTAHGSARVPTVDQRVPAAGSGALEGEVWFPRDLSDATIDYPWRYLRMPESLSDILRFDRAGNHIVLDEGSLSPAKEVP